MFRSQTLIPVFKRLGSSKNLCVAYSGGLDSHVLLHSVAALRMSHPKLQIRAIHIHHGLSPNADNWAMHCQQVCDTLHIPLTIKHIEPKVYKTKSNLEEVAREQRYAIFSEMLEPNESLLTAHHQDDQTETLLLRLLRGAGLRGLSAMSEIRNLGYGSLVRPLLHISRADLKAYAQREKLCWIEDESNANQLFDRNYLRHEVMPLLSARWMGVSQVLSRTAQHCKEMNRLLDEVAEQDYVQVQGGILETLSVDKLLNLSPARQKNVLRFWLKALGFSLPSSQILEHLLKDCLQAKEDAQPLLTWRDKAGFVVEVRRFEGDLYVLKIGMGQTSFLNSAQNKRYDIYPPKNAKITLRYRQGGERFHPLGRMGSHPLKKLLQEWHIPPWLRDRVPLIYVDEELAVVVGYGIAKKYASAGHGRRKKVLLECRGSSMANTQIGINMQVLG